MKYPETVSPSTPRTTVNEHSVIAEPYITISRHRGGSWGECPCPLWPFPSSKISHVPSELKCNTFLVKMSFVCMWLVSIASHLTSHWVSNSEIWFVGNLWGRITWQSPKNNCVGSYSELACSNRFTNSCETNKVTINNYQGKWVGMLFRYEIF